MIPAVAPTNVAANLFDYVQSPDAPRLDEALPAPARRVYYVRPNRDLIAGERSPFWQKAGEGRVVVPLPDGTTLTTAIEGSEMLGADRFTEHGPH